MSINWWDYLDLNQESTNYEFAALTNYAIVPYTVKDEPQPQLAFAFGFLIIKELLNNLFS